MGERVYLNVDTNEGLLFIPFVGLRELDLFTVGYENSFELINSLNRMLDIFIDIDSVKRIYISGDMYKKSDKGSLSKIKYSSDNFDKELLAKMYALYLKQDRRRVMRSDIRNIITEGMVKFKGGKSLSDKDIEKAVEIYFDKDYKNQRDAYFIIKDFAKTMMIDGKEIGLVDRVSLKEFSFKEKKEHRMNILDMLEARNDDYFKYLLELFARDREQYDKVMDELSGYGLDELSAVLDLKGKKLFDGLNGNVNNKDSKTNTKKNNDDCYLDGDSIIDEDLYMLEYCTLMKIDMLQDLVYEFRNNSIFEDGFGRSR